MMSGTRHKKTVAFVRGMRPLSCYQSVRSVFGLYKDSRFGMPVRVRFGDEAPGPCIMGLGFRTCALAHLFTSIPYSSSGLRASTPFGSHAASILHLCHLNMGYRRPNHRRCIISHTHLIKTGKHPQRMRIRGNCTAIGQKLSTENVHIPQSWEQPNVHTHSVSSTGESK
jgi:hypothetical protein